jgi:glycosyltransferase involved in cell wall biosynthesis
MIPPPPEHPPLPQEMLLSTQHFPETKRELRVLHVFSALGMGGAETWLMALLKYFHKHQEELPFRVQLDVCLTGGQENYFDEEARSLGANLFYITYTRKKLIRFAKEFRRLLVEGRYDAVHDHQDYTAGWHFLMGFGRLPAVRMAHVHNPFFCVEPHSAELSRRLTWSTGRYILSRLATDITGTSHEILEKYGFNDPAFSQMNVIAAHCGFDVSRYSGAYESNHGELCREFGWPVSVKILLFAGRLNTVFGNGLNQKNPFFALDVARACIQENPEVRMLIAGGGQEVEAELNYWINLWGLGGKICVLGVRDDIPRLMLGSDLFLFPSLEEGLGMVAVEAQAAGLRVLMSNCVPSESIVIPELVETCSLSESASHWAKVALSLINLPKPDVLECNQRVRHSPFSIENSAVKLIELYSRRNGFREAMVG